MAVAGPRAVALPSCSVPAETVVPPLKVLEPLEQQRAAARLGQAAAAADRAGDGLGVGIGDQERGAGVYSDVAALAVAAAQAAVLAGAVAHLEHAAGNVVPPV